MINSKMQIPKYESIYSVTYWLLFSIAFKGYWREVTCRLKKSIPDFEMKYFMKKNNIVLDNRIYFNQ